MMEVADANQDDATAPRLQRLRHDSQPVRGACRPRLADLTSLGVTTPPGDVVTAMLIGTVDVESADDDSGCRRAHSASKATP
jgi:hypothetical protein